MNSLNEHQVNVVKLNIVEKIPEICDATVNKKPKNDELLCH